MSGGLRLLPRGIDWAAWLVALVAAAAYLITLTSGYVSDDFALLYFARQAGPAEMLAEFAPPPVRGAGVYFYRPLGMLLWWAADRLGGLWLQHALSIGLHALCALLLYRLARRLGLAPRTAVCAGLIFALFPAHSEAVAWLSARFDLGATALTLAATLALLRPGRAAPWRAAGAVALALLYKESALVAPGLMTLCLLWRRASGQAGGAAGSRLPGVWLDLLALTPSAATVATYLAWRAWLFGGLGGYQLAGPFEAGFWQSAAALAPQLWIYLSAPMNWPLLFALASGSPWPIWLGAGALGGLCLLALYDRRLDRRPGASLSLGHVAMLGLVWALVAALPLVGTGGYNPAAMASGRYTYLPAAGACLALAALLCDYELLLRHGPRLRRSFAWRYALLGAIFTLMAASVLSRSIVWRAAGERADAAIAAIVARHPAPVPQTTFVVAGRPDSYRGAYVLRNGLAEALILRYNRQALRVINRTELAQRPPPRYDRLIFLNSDDLRLTLDDAPDQPALQTSAALMAALPGLREPRFTGNFYAEERSAEHIWRWMGRAGCITLTAAAEREAAIGLRLWSAGPLRRVRIRLNDRLWQTLEIGQAIQDVQLESLLLGTEPTRLCLEADGVAPAGPGDSRALSVAVGDMQIGLSQGRQKPIQAT